MQSTLRSLLTAAVVTAAAALATHPAMAAGATVNVPFNFSASGKQCPAGTYHVDLAQMDQVVRLSDASSRQTFEWLAGPGEPNPSDRRIVLRFDRAGSTYSLHSVQYGSAITAPLDKKSPSEQLTEIVGQ